ncbi:ABC transporter ATP-binding protein [Fischerella sp. PCC 9605]|uniref:ABC transporter ATP-binding protein n=1 Tax=Fischerella sp. PCC 9605 TaxID=1173024 RepID=UPI000478791C|nr:ABC transporter ATP-binding protein [Fischerella sp. PCC 9605]
MGRRPPEQTLKAAIPSILQVVRRFRPLLCKQRLLLAGSFLALLVETALKLLEPWPLKFVFDRIIVTQSNTNPSSVAVGYGISPMVLLTLLALAIVAIAGLRAFAAYLSTFGMALVTTRVMAEVRGNLYSHLQRLSLSFHNQFKSGDLISCVTYDVERLRMVALKAALPLLTNFFTLVGMLGVMFWLNWELALIAIVTFPLFLFSTTRLIHRIRSATRQHRQWEGAIANIAAEAIGAIKVVQALSLQEMLEKSFFKHNKKSLDQGTQAEKLRAMLERTVEVLIAISTALVLWRGSQLVPQKALTPGELLVFMSYLKSAFDPMRLITKQIGLIAKAAASGERIIDLLDIVPNIRDLKGAIDAPVFHGAVRFEHVSFAYELGKGVLRDISFEVQPGQHVALVGPSGGGKSSLVSLLLRLYDPLEGRILIDGHDIREYKLESLRRQISIVLQDSVLFAVSVRDNIAYGLLCALDEEIQAAARLANAHDFIMELPQGYDTILGERGATLSGGQRQRIAIARAAVRQAPIVILDEPTTGLDNENERLVSEALERLTQSRTTFLISHNLRAVEQVDLILYIEGGRIVECGTHKELMRFGGRYAAMHALQTSIGNSNSHYENGYQCVNDKTN